MKANQIPTPVGDLAITCNKGSLIHIHFADEKIIDEHSSNITIRTAADQLTEYFNGQRQTFSIDIQPKGTPFQQQVWKILMEIPFGKTRTYVSLAKELGDINKTRAVGAAIAANPLLILIPCHRVVAANGNLTGYSGGIRRKQWLLHHEHHISTGQQQLF